VTRNILLNSDQLATLSDAGKCTIVDCRFDLNDTEKGRHEYLGGHIQGARYAHLDNDLSSPIEAHTGRHPLPETQAFARFLSRIGWTEDSLLVAYDEGSSAVAVRLWWLMRYYGKPAAVLDGGLAAWKAAGHSLEIGESAVNESPLCRLTANTGMTVLTDELVRGSNNYTVIDARASERFSGEVEPLDSKAGHIPGAINRPFGSNLLINGRFKKAEELKQQYQSLLGQTPLEEVVHSCGSGVTACHNLFAMELAGLNGSKVYPGSWSEWIRDPARPIETGL
jgi:thiosulfate/3-mercaptopyruvate sulfurtransferase